MLWMARGDGYVTYCMADDLPTSLGNHNRGPATLYGQITLSIAQTAARKATRSKRQGHVARHAGCQRLIIRSIMPCILAHPTFSHFVPWARGKQDQGQIEAVREVLLP